MASLQKKGDSWHCQFLYKKQRRTWVLGPVSNEAHKMKSRVEYLLMRVRQHLKHVPSGMDIVDWLIADGEPPDYYLPPRPKETTFRDLRDSYLQTHGNGTVEKIHSTPSNFIFHTSPLHWAKTFPSTRSRLLISNAMWTAARR